MSKKIAITPEGYKKLNEEYNYLCNVKRPEVAKKLQEARGYGDLSENAEYDAAREDQALVELKIEELKVKLDNVKIVDSSKISTKIIGIGNTITFKDINTNEEYTFKLLGPHECDIVNGIITTDSAVGKELLGKKVGEQVDIMDKNKDIISYKITAISV